MQFRFPTELSAEEYVRTEAWKFIVVVRCPLHPDSDCRITRHGTYPRVIPEGTKIVRILCHTENIAFSLLPDCFSSRLPGTLADVETVFLMAETVARNSGFDISPDAAGKILSAPDLATVAEEAGVGQRLFDLASDFGWLKRRIEYVIAILSAVAGFFPETFGNCPPTLDTFRSILGSGPMLIRLRAIAEPRIHEIPAPVGLNPRFSTDVPSEGVLISVCNLLIFYIFSVFSQFFLSGYSGSPDRQYLRKTNIGRSQQIYVASFVMMRLFKRNAVTPPIPPKTKI